MPQCTNCGVSMQKKGLCSSCKNVISSKEENDALDGLNSKIDLLLKKTGDLGTSLENCHASIKTLTEKVDGVIAKVEDLTGRVVELEDAGSRMVSEVSFLKSALNTCEQRILTNGNSIEIHGIPLRVDEDLYSIVFEVGKALGVDIPEDRISSVFRLRPGPQFGDRRQPPVIMLRLVNQRVKDKIISAKKQKKLTTRDIGCRENEVHPIYINEALTPYSKKIYKICKDMKSDKKIKFLWVKNGTVLIRKNAGDNSISIRSFEQLKDI